MKVISLLQPWASLVTCGCKHIETRSWATKYRGPLAIHVSARLGIDQLLLVAQNEYFSKALNLELHMPKAYYREALPTGKILAVTNLVDCIKIPEPTGNDVRLHEDKTEAHVVLGSDEYVFGDFRPGRYAWVLWDIRLLSEPVPAKGKLGLWDFEISQTPFIIR